MYEQLLKTKFRPFRATPDAKFYYAHESIEAARQTAVRAIVRAEGPVMVVGGAGLGKSLLGQLVANDTLGRFDIVNLHAARLCSRQALLQNMLFELQMPYRGLSEGELRLSILDRLEPSPELPPEGLLIIVDEAHTLPPKLLDELRLINNFTREGQPRTRLLLLGSLRLEDVFAQPQMDSFNQRLAARCYLQAMSRQDTHNYVRHQLAVVGVDANKFITVDALDAVHSACEGLPRLTNQIMDHAIIRAAETRQAPISSSLIEEAWAELQQLPAPWHAGEERRQASVANASASIEFGSLDDDEELDLLPLVATEPATSESPGVGADSESVDAWTVHGELDGANLELNDRSTSEEETPNFFAAFELSTDDALPVFDVEPFDQPQLAESVVQSNADSVQSAAEAEGIEHAERREDALNVPTNSADAAIDAGQSTQEPRILFDASLAFPTLNLSPSQQSFVESSLNAQARSEQEHKEPEEPPQPEIESQPLSWDTAIGDSPVVGSTNNFFSTQQTDERMLAFADEQDQYDSMGVWENDPPIANPFSAAQTFESAGISPNGPNQGSLNSIDADQSGLSAKGFEVVEPEWVQFDSLNTLAPASRKPVPASAIDECSNAESQRPEPDAAPEPNRDSTIEPLQTSTSVFGDDFEEEFAITSDSISGLVGRATRYPQLSEDGISETVEPSVNGGTPSEPTKAEWPTRNDIGGDVNGDASGSDDIAAAAAAYIEELQQFASNVTSRSDQMEAPFSVEDVLADMDQTYLPANLRAESLDNNSVESDVESGWRVDAHSTDVENEMAVQNELEDIVSQLNFSAFSVEPYSIEQIEVDGSALPNDGVKRGDEDQVYLLHRPQPLAEESIFSQVAEYDDDRDLLIVDEDVPVSSKTVEPVADEKPTTRPTAYSQLFAKLRR